MLSLQNSHMLRNLLVTIISGISLVAITQTNAGPLNISNTPLETASGVESNVMILNDDSGSMANTILISSGPEQGRFGTYRLSVTGFGFNDYSYTHNDGDNLNRPLLPTESRLNAINASIGGGLYSRSESAQGVWRGRLSDFNRLYYNPDVTYQPWGGEDRDDVTFGNQPPGAARLDPYLPDAGNTISLTTQLGFSTFIPGIGTRTDSIYPASYYTWTDSNGDGNVDFNEPHTLMQIRLGGGGTCPPTAPPGTQCPENFPRRSTRTDCGGSGEDAGLPTSCSAALELQNFANWYSYYRRSELTAKAAISNVIADVQSERIGYAVINDRNTQIRVATMTNPDMTNPDTPVQNDITTGNKKNLLDEIFLTQSPNQGTPLRASLDAVGLYFACETGNIFGDAASAPGSEFCPTFSADNGGECQQNYTLLMTDGFWNGTYPASGETGVGDADSNDNKETPAGVAGTFDGASFADGPLPNPNPGPDGITFINTNTLADIAMFYYERDLHNDLGDEVETTDIDEDRYIGPTDPFETMHQHMVTYTIGFGVSSTVETDPDMAIPLPPNFLSDPFDWPPPAPDTPSTIDDLRHAAWNGRGQFLSANNPEELQTAIEAFIEGVSAGSGASAAIAFNPFDSTTAGNDTLFSAIFDNDNGDLIAEVVDANNDFTFVWSAAQQLDSLTDVNTDSRTIVTFNSATEVGVPFDVGDISPAQLGQLSMPVIANTVPADLAEDRLEYLRGQTANESTDNTRRLFRQRGPSDLAPLTQPNLTTTGRLGDIVRSSPIFNGEPEPSPFRDQAPYPTAAGELYSEYVTNFQNRRSVVYVGANDGMQHAFNAATGVEEFAYVPNLIFDRISDLTERSYNHQFFVDISPTIEEVYFTPTRGTQSGNASWNSVLVGGTGINTPGYFALNITEPNSFNNEASMAANVMWEFSQADDIGTVVTPNDLNLGGNVNAPLIALSNIEGAAGQGNRWVVIFGNGYNSASVAGNAELYVLLIDGGQDGTWDRGTDFIKINTGNGKAQSGGTNDTPNSLGGVRGVDQDGNGTVDIVYAGDLQGNLYRFDLSGTSMTALETATNASQILYRARLNNGTEVQPITATPITVPVSAATPSAAGNVVIFGTGRYFTTDDATSTDIQSIYGIWDNVTNASNVIEEVDFDDLVPQTFTNTGNILADFGISTSTFSTVTYSKSDGNSGWRINLDVLDVLGLEVEFPGERAIRNFILTGGNIFTSTVFPSSTNSCDGSPGGAILGFDPLSGGAPSEPAFDLNNDGMFDEGDNVNAQEGQQNIATRLTTGVPGGIGIVNGILRAQLSNLDKVAIRVNPGDEVNGRQSWKEVDLGIQ